MLICSTNIFYTATRIRVAEFYVDFKFVAKKSSQQCFWQKRYKIHFAHFSIFWSTDHVLMYALIMFSSMVQHRPWIEYIEYTLLCISMHVFLFLTIATVFLVTEIIPGLHDTSIYNTRGKSSLFSCDTYSSIYRTKICNSSLWQNFHLFRRKLYVWLA